MQATLIVALGGAVGSVARYWLALLMLPISRQLPWGTIVINIIGWNKAAFLYPKSGASPS